jgi:hypothetical protein
VDAHTFTEQVEKFKQTSAIEMTATVSGTGQKRSADCRIHATKDHNNVRCVLLDTIKTA